MLQGRRNSRRRRLAALVLAAGLSAALLPSPALAVDLTVTNVEVSQGIQTPNNSLLLVSRRGTVVRATVGIFLSSGEVAPSNVTGRLHVFRNNVALTPAAGVAPLPTPPFSEPLLPDRNREDHTLNFELPAPTAITSTTNLDVRVDVTPVAGETATGNNSGFANDLKVEDRLTPRIFYVRINYTPNGRGFPQNSLIRRGVGDMHFRGTMPFNDADANLYKPLPLLPDIAFSLDSNGNNDLDTRSDRNQLLANLATLRQILVLFNVLPFFPLPGIPADSFIYGWLNGPVQGNGLGQVGGRAAFGNTEDERHQGSFTHEVTHNFGFNHINSTITDTGWDVGARLLNNPSGNSVTQRVMPSTLFDVQVGGKLTAQRWVADFKYLSLLGNAAFRSAPPSGLASAAATPRRRVAVIHGIFNDAGTRLIELKPVFRYPWPSEPTPTDRNGPFKVELRTTSGRTISVPFNAIVGDDQEPGVHTTKGFFEVMVPVTGELDRLRIMSRDGRRTFGQLNRTRPPTVRIQSFRPGNVLRGLRTARWTVSDPDTPTSRLRYQVAYSNDGGKTFMPVAVNLPGLSARFDTRRAGVQRGKGIFRVLVSDGLNTTFHDVGGLTVRR